MPTYEYRCAEGHDFERFQKISDRPVNKCPTCGAKATRRISGGQGLIFKGSGFYITDYGKDGKGPRKAAEAGEGGGSAAPETAAGADAKPAAKAEPSAAPAKTTPPPKKADGA